MSSDQTRGLSGGAAGTGLIPELAFTPKVRLVGIPPVPDVPD